MRAVESADRDSVQPVILRGDVQHVEVLALVLVDPLHLNVEQPVGIQLDAGCRADEVASRALLARLTARHLAVEGGVVRVGLQPAKLIQVRQPAVTDRVVEQLPQARVGEREEPPWRDAVGLVGTVPATVRKSLSAHCL
jgi:hypothetical protein